MWPEEENSEDENLADTGTGTNETDNASSESSSSDELSSDESDGDSNGEDDVHEEPEEEDNRTLTEVKNAMTNYLFSLVRWHLSERTYYLQIVAGDLVLLNFLSTRVKKYIIEYVERVEEVLDDGNFYVNYLTQYNNRKNDFVFPIFLLEEIVANSSIISVLPAQVRRGHYIFPYNVM